MKKRTNWNLKLLYKSPSDPQIEKDLKKYERAMERFGLKYGEKEDFLKNPTSLKKALDEYFGIESLPGSSKPYIYFWYKKDMGNISPSIMQKLTQYESRLMKASNHVVFFPIQIKKVSKEKQRIFLNSTQLKEYKYFLKLLFKESKHTLSEPEQKIVNLKSQPARSIWVTSLENALAKKTVKHGREEISLAEAANNIPSLPTARRRKLHDQVMEKCKELEQFAESEINAIFTDKKINDELYKYDKPYSATVQSYENDEEDIEKFVALVTKNFDISHRFFKLKKEMLGLPNLQYADRGAKVGSIRRDYSFNEACNILNTSFGKVDEKYSNILSAFLKQGQIDVFPKKNKSGGAYCSSTPVAPTFVLLNHVNTFDSVNTFAHEMGHAFHSELSKTQPIQYESYTTSVAETASTLFENFVFDEIFETLSEKEKVIALHDKIQGSISTIFRQIACFNFEYELHMRVRKDGFVPVEEIKNILNKHMSAYMGRAVKLRDLDGYFFIQWSHIRRPFYVYSYAFGELISSALYEEYKKDPKFLKKIETFLKAGSSISPKDIFRQAGIDISDMSFFRKGLKKIEKDIEKLEKLVK